jgi:hypothetical protein
MPALGGVADLSLVRRMRAAAILLSLTTIASAAPQTRIIGRIAAEDVRGITAAIRAATRDRIVSIRGTPSSDRVGVQTESGPSAGCHYLVERSGGAWHIAGKSCWTHVIQWPQDAEKRWPHVVRPSELSELDFSQIKAALAKHTHDHIRTIKVVGKTPLSVQVHTASPHIVTEGDFTLEKIGDRWKVTKESQLIH